MDRQDVPQDAVATYGGLRKLLYAVDEDGHYGGVTSSGWEAESFATELAVNCHQSARVDLDAFAHCALFCASTNCCTKFFFSSFSKPSPFRRDDLSTGR